MNSVGGPTGTSGNVPVSTGLPLAGQTGNMQAASNQNPGLAQPGAPGSLPSGPPSGPIGSTNAFTGGSNIPNSGSSTLPSTGSSGSIGNAGGGAKRKEIYKYEAPWTVYSMNWSVRPDKRFRLALGSFVEEYNNKVCISKDIFGFRYQDDSYFPSNKNLVITFLQLLGSNSSS